jgi:hypothetical protein
MRLTFANLTTQLITDNKKAFYHVLFIHVRSDWMMKRNHPPIPTCWAQSAKAFLAVGTGRTSGPVHLGPCHLRFRPWSWSGAPRSYKHAAVAP